MNGSRIPSKNQGKKDMRNRAKCKVCEEIIESKHIHDYVTCKCGQISIDGGPQSKKDGAYWTRAIDYANFVRIDDEGNDVPVTYIEKKKDEVVIPEEFPPMTREQKLDELHRLTEFFDALPGHAKHQPVTQYEFQSLILLLESLLREDR